MDGKGNYSNMLEDSFNQQILKQEKEREDLVSNFIRGDHILRNIPNEQYLDLDRESKLYEQSVEVFANSRFLRSDFHLHVGDVKIPELSPEEIKRFNEQEVYVNKMNGRMDIFREAKMYREEVAKLVDCINVQEEEIASIQKDVERYKNEYEFEWQVQKQNRSRELRAKTVVDMEDLENARDRLKRATDIINTKYPDMSSKITLEQSVNDDFGKVYGWCLGRLDSTSDFDENGKIINLMFGLFTREVTPPVNGYIFVGQNFDRNLLNSSLILEKQNATAAASVSLASGNSLSDSTMTKDKGSTASSTNGFELSNLEMGIAKFDNISITPFSKVNLSSKAVGSQSRTVLAYRVAGCSVEAINGEYLEAGKSSKVTKYKNIRGWTIFRATLTEIPELGIFADNCYEALKGPSINVLLEQKANLAYSELVNNELNIKEGTVQFKRRFAEMSRAGNRLINSDQTFQLLFNNNLKASLRSESDQAMMSMLQAMYTMRSSEEGVEENKSTNDPFNVTSVSENPATATDEHKSISPETKPKLMRNVEEDDDEIGIGFNENSIFSNSMVESTTGQEQFGVGSLSQISDEGMGSRAEESGIRSLRHEFKHKKKKSVRQDKMQSFNKSRHDASMSLSSVNESSATTVKSWGEDGYVTGTNLDIKVTLSHSINYQVGSQGFPLAKSKRFLVQEAELAREVTSFIEEREAEIMTLRIQAELAQRKYIESDTLLSKMNLDELMGSLFDQVRVVRDKTVKVTEALGAWIRLCTLEKNKKANEYYSAERKDPRAERTYCVAIAFKGTMLYPPSKPMKSNARAFRRGLEEMKSSTDVKIIGIYNTREEAALVFEKAYSNIPSEQALDVGGSEGKMLVGMRACGKHYLVRSVHVPSDLPCEACASKDYSKPNYVVPQVSEEPLPQFIWQGKNYLEKIWSDTSFLSDNLLLRKVVPDLDLENNPLLLTRDTYRETLNSLFLNPDNPLNFLKGRLEQISSAANAGTRVKKVLDGHELMGIGLHPDYGFGHAPPDLDKATDKIISETQDAYIYKEATFMDSVKMSQTISSPSRKRNTLEKSEQSQTNKKSLFSKSMSSVIDPMTKRPASSPSLTPWNTLSPLNILSEDVVGSSFDPEAVRRAHKERGGNCLTWLDVNTDDKIETDRLKRALNILGHSSTLTKQKLHPDAIADTTRAPALERRPLLRSVSADTSALTNESKGKNDSVTIQDVGADYSNVPGYGPGKTVYTEAVYTFRGAKLVSGQMRAPVAHRVDDVWCRTDEGEFTGISKGRAARAYDFQVKILEEGKARNKERKLVQDELRRLFTVHIASVDIPRMEFLVARAKIVKGSTIALDIAQAETYMRNRTLDIKKCLIIQRLLRGNVARERVRQIRRVIAEKKARIRSAIVHATMTGRSMVSNIIDSCLKRQVQRESKPSFFISANMSGVYSIVSIYDRCRHARRSLDLCTSCQTKSLVKIFDPISCKTRVERAVCTCNQVQGPETWWLRVFDPLSGNTLEKEFDINKVRAVVQEIVKVETLMDPVKRLAALVGKSFGDLAPLFDPNEASFDIGNPSKSYSMARLKAALESSVLPLLPKSISSMLLNALNERIFLPIDKLKFLDFKFTSLPDTITDVQELERAKRPAWNFQPIADFKAAARHLARGKEKVQIYNNRIQNSDEHFAKCKLLNAQHMTTSLEWDLMEFEDARTLLIRTTDSLESAAQKLESVMNFSKSGLEKFTLEEKNQSEDWHQSYDVFEEGGAGCGLNIRRKIEVLWKKQIEDYHAKFVKVPVALRVHVEQKKAIVEGEKLAKLNREEAEKYYPTIDFISSAEVEVKRLAVETVKCFVSTLSMPRKARKSGRRIQWVRYDRVFVRDPLERARKENRGAWTFLDRKIMALRPVSSIAKFVLRCNVEIFTDPTTGFFIIHIGQDDLPVEESTQHLDLGLVKSDFSDLTSHGLDNDIVLRPMDVDLILSRSPSWPAEHLEKLPVQFVNGSLTLKLLAAEKREAEMAAAAALAAKDVIDSSDDDRSVDSSSVKSPKMKAKKSFKNQSPKMKDSKSLQRGRTTNTSNSPPKSPSPPPPSIRRANTSKIEKSDKSDDSDSETNSSSRKSISRGKSKASLTARSRSPTDAKFSDSSDTESNKPSANLIKSGSQTQLLDPKGKLIKPMSKGSSRNLKKLNAQDSSKRIALTIEVESTNITTNLDILREGENESNANGNTNDRENLASIDLAAVNHSQLDAHIYIPPSKRPRPLNQIVVFKNAVTKYSELPKTYGLRRKKLETFEVSRATRLFEYLRLQPHTGRPCLGLLHFMRRIEYSSKYIIQCLWYKDTITENPASWSNEILNSIRSRTLCNSIVTTAATYSLHHLQFNIRVQDKNLGIVLPISDVLYSMTSKPLLLASMLLELIVNRFSPDTLEYILDGIDIQVPGQDAVGGRWRQSFRHEMPRLHYTKDQSSKFRGPLYCNYKFMSGTYFRAAFYMNDKDDIRIRFSAPTDGNFWGHMYKGQPFTVDLTRDELRVFVSKVCMHGELVPQKFYSSLDILHPMNADILFPLILETIILADGVSDGLRFTQHPELEEEDVFNLENLQKCVSKITRKFNVWSKRSNGCVHSISNEQINSMMQSIEELYTRTPQWHLMLQQDDPRRKLVEVYADIWASKDVERFFGVAGVRAIEKFQVDLMQSTTGAPSRMLGLRNLKDTEVPILETVGSHHNSYWRVRVMSDESKGNFLMEVLPSTIENLSVQNFLAEKELQSMYLEDEKSKLSQQFQENIELQRGLSKNLAKLEEHMRLTLLPRITMIEKTTQIAKMIINESRSLFLVEADRWMSERRKSNLSRIKNCLIFDDDDCAEITLGGNNVTGIPLTVNKHNFIMPSSIVKKHTHTRSAKESVPPLVLSFVSWLDNFLVGLSSSSADVKTSVVNCKQMSMKDWRKYPNEITQIGRADYSTSDYPRYLPYRGPDLTGAQQKPSFRDGRIWQRSNFLNSASILYNSNVGGNNEKNLKSGISTTIMNINGHMLLVSEPTFGPADLVGLKLLDPRQGKAWSLIASSNVNMKLPSFDAASSTASSEQSSLENKNYPIERTIAETVVWTVLLHGVTSIVVTAMDAMIEKSRDYLSAEIDETLESIEDLKEELMDAKLKLNNVEIEMKEEAALNDDEDENYYSSDSDSDSDCSSDSGSSIAENEEEEPTLLSSDDSSDDDEVEASDVSEEIVIPTRTRQRNGPNNTGLGLPTSSMGASSTISRFLPGEHGRIVSIVFVPADEALSASYVETYAVFLPFLFRNYLKHPSNTRIHTLSSIIYTASAPEEGWDGEKTINTRMTRWVRDYDEHYGWRDGEAALILQKKLANEIKYHPNSLTYNSSEEIIGNALILLRSHADMPIIQQWMKLRYDEYEPIRQQRLLKEGREKQFRISNHAKFRKRVFDLSAAFLQGLERIFDFRTTPADEPSFKISPLHCRILLSHYLSLRGISDDSPISAQEKLVDPLTLDEAFLLDTDVAHEDLTLTRFDNMPTPVPPFFPASPHAPAAPINTVSTTTKNDILEVVEESMHSPNPPSLHPDLQVVLEWNPKTFYVETTKLGKSSMKREELTPRAGQIMYAMYQLHVCSCTKPLSLCPFPGCNAIRSHALALMQLHPYTPPPKPSFPPNPEDPPPPSHTYEGLIVSDELLSKEFIDNPVSHAQRNLSVTNDAAIESNASLASQTKSNNEFTTVPPTNMSTGRHPIEMAIKLYLLQGIELLGKALPVAYSSPVPSPWEEIEEEKKKDDEDLQRLRDLEELKIEWRSILIESNHLRRINRRILRPELGKIMNAEEILEARGGELGSKDYQAVTNREEFEYKHALQNCSSNSPSAHLITHVSAPDIMASQRASVLQQSQALPPPSNEIVVKKEKSVINIEENESETTFSPVMVVFPTALALKMLGGVVGRDGKGHHVPHSAIDPYPPRRNVHTPAKVHEHTHSHHHSHHHPHGKHHQHHLPSHAHPMERSMFEWITRHFSVCRPRRIPLPVSGDRGQKSKNSLGIRFDRLHCEGVCTLADGSIVVLQIMHGVLEGMSVCMDDISGIPPGAIRYVPSHLLSSLVNGFTLLLYDTRSDVSVCVVIEAKIISRFAEAFDVNETDLPQLAQRMLAMADKLIRLSRVGDVCTGMTLDLSNIHTFYHPSSMRQGMSALNQRNNGGRRGTRGALLSKRAGVFDARSNRLNAAKALLSSTSPLTLSSLTLKR